MIESRRFHLVVAGVTTRALAISAARAGYRVTAVDAFGDLDLRSEAEVIALRADGTRPYSPAAAALAASAVPAGLAAYTANLENYPRSVARLARHRRLLGNPPEVLARVRDPILLMRVLARRGFAIPKTRATPPAEPARHSWLLKPRRSGGGHGIRNWQPRRSVPRAAYLQQHLAGIPGSVVFAADGRSAVPLGLTRQLVGDARFGSAGFRYAGSLLASSGSRLFPREPELLEAAGELAAAVTAEFGLVGLNGVDFIARKGVPYPVEVNPRFCASMELIERAIGASMFELHQSACLGVLPAVPAPAAQVEGKAIVFARRDVRLGDTRDWDGTSIADIPHPGEHIRQGHPVCTVFARGDDGFSCYRKLVRRARGVYRNPSRRLGVA